MTLKHTVLGALGSSFLPHATVEKVELISERFRLIVLNSEKFKGAGIQPAAKIRINAGGWEMRAYTPLSIDAATERLLIVAFLHGEGLGSTWARSVVPGDLTHVIGPQRSLDLLGFSQSAIFFGDETSFAAAKTLQSHLAPGNATRFVFEVSSAVEAQAVADRLELRDFQAYERQAYDAHLSLVIQAIRQALGDIGTSHLVLTGNGRSIQAIRTNLRSRDPTIINYHVKAYWAPGKTGLE